jgi:ABC-2 type transport system ATP-binding protein
VDKAFRHVILTFDGPVDARSFDALPGVEGLKADGPRLSFTLHSEPDAMVKLAARHRLVGMEYERPSLEEIFLTYYGHDGEER